MQPDMGYENNIYAASIGTSFEQYQDVDAFIGAEVSYDDLKTLKFSF